MKILFFAPHSAIWVHAFPEALVAESLATAGHEIVYVGCGRRLRDHCVPMSAHRIAYDAGDEMKSQICKKCENAESTIRKGFGFRGGTLNDWLSPEDEVVADEVSVRMSANTALETCLHGVEVGRIALYEVLLGTKKTGLDGFTPGDWQRYRSSVRNVVRALLVVRRVVAMEQPDRIVTYNSLYGVNHAASRYCELNGIPAVFLHAGMNLSHRLATLLVGRGTTVRFYGSLLERWETERDQPRSPHLLSRVTDHFLELLRWRSVFAYSAAHTSNLSSLRSRLGIPENKRVIVATMSSPDERYAGEIVGAMKAAPSLAFASQIDWILATLAWVSGRPDVFLVVRVHPREFPNKRETVASEHAQRLREVLETLPSNAIVNWPEDQLSLYDLAGVADIFLNAWSSAGKEMSLLGIPVVTYTPELLFYPPDLNYAVRNEADYFLAIERALEDGWNEDRVRAAYRWCVLEFELAPFDLSAAYPQADRAGLGPVVRRVAERVLAHVGGGAAFWFDCRMRRRLPESDSIVRVVTGAHDTRFDFEQSRNAVSREAETAGLRREVRRLSTALFPSSSGDTGSLLQSQLLAFAEG